MVVFYSETRTVKRKTGTLTDEGVHILYATHMKNRLDIIIGELNVGFSDS